MSFGLDDLSVNELEELIVEAQQQLKQRQKADVQKVYLQMVQLATSVGMSLEDVISEGRASMGRKEKADKPKLAPKYRNPENSSETWTGRGRTPLWLADALARGHALEQFLIR